MRRKYCGDLLEHNADHFDVNLALVVVDGCLYVASIHVPLACQQVIIYKHMEIALVLSFARLDLENGTNESPGTVPLVRGSWDRQ